MSFNKLVLLLSFALTFVGCKNKTAPQSESQESTEPKKEYTIHYEMRGKNPMEPNSTEELTLLRRKLYINENFGVIRTYPGDENSPFNQGIEQIKEYGYLDIKNQTLTNVHKWPDQTLTTIEKFSDKKPYELTEETKTILGYECKKAIFDMNGQKIAVWYTNDFPLKTGTLFFGAELGFVLEMYQFEAVKIENNIPEDIALELPKDLGKIVSEDELMEKMMGQ